MNSYLELLGTDRFASMVAAAAVDVDLTADQVEGMIGAKGDIDTVLFTATVTSGSRALALSVAGAVATQFVDLVRDVETTGDTPPSVNLEVVDGPTVVELPKRPLFSLRGGPRSVGSSVWASCCCWSCVIRPCGPKTT